MLGLGLILYEMRFTKDKAVRTENIKLALAIVVISLATLITYNLIAAHLTKAYAYSYAELPPPMQVTSINARELNNLAGILTGTNQANNLYAPPVSYYLATSLVVVFLGFGIASLLDPVTSIVLTAPWLVEVFLIGSLNFLATWFQYFSFALGGAIVVTLLTMRRLLEVHKKRAFFKSLFVSSIIVIVMLLSVMAPFFISSRHNNDISQSFLFQVNSTQEKYYSDLSYVISKIPPNASVISPDFTMPQLR